MAPAEVAGRGAGRRPGKTEFPRGGRCIAVSSARYRERSRQTA